MVTPVDHHSPLGESPYKPAPPAPRNSYVTFSTLSESRPQRIWSRFWDSAFIEGIRRKAHRVFLKISAALSPGWEWIKQKLSPLFRWIKVNLLFFLFDPKEELRADLYDEVEKFIRATIHSEDLNRDSFYSTFEQLSDPLKERIRWHVGKRLEESDPGKEESYYENKVTQLMKESPYGDETSNLMIVQEAIQEVRQSLSRWY